MLIKRTAPQAEPITLEEAKLHVRINPDDTSEDKDILIPLISAAREFCENRTGRSFAVQTISVCPESSGTVRLPYAPVISVDSVTTLQGEPVEYAADIFRGTVEVDRSDVVITYTAGGDEIPALMRQAMLMLIDDWYNNRGDSSIEVTGAVKTILNQNKRWWF